MFRQIHFYLCFWRKFLWCIFNSKRLYGVQCYGFKESNSSGDKFELKLYAYEDSVIPSNGIVNLSVYELSQAENSALTGNTYTDSQNSVFNTSSFGNLIAAGLNANRGEFVTIDVTSYVEDYMALMSENDSFLGFAFSCSDDMGSAIFGFDEIHSPSITMLKASIPEPSTYSMILGAFAILAVFIARKKM